jgi:hypothetical protein
MEEISRVMKPGAAIEVSGSTMIPTTCVDTSIWGR